MQQEWKNENGIFRRLSYSFPAQRWSSKHCSDNQSRPGTGLQEIAITDHGPLALGIGLRDAGVLAALRQDVDALNCIYTDINILLGVEANIRDLQGTLDIQDLKPLDILIAGLHP